MNDRADVGLVDAHAERIGGDDERHRAGHEGVLRLGSVLRALAAVVGRAAMPSARNSARSASTWRTVAA